MLTIVIIMLVILAVATAVVVYAAFPHRGEDVPGVPWLGDAMSRAADAFPVIDDDTGEITPHHTMWH